MHSVLSVALENAVVWELIGRNVAKRVKRPRIERYEPQTLTVKQAITLLEVARGSRLEALLLVALTTGMRRDELLALRWSDVDLDSRVLHVRRTMNFIGGLGYVEGEPKTRAGWRNIVLPDVAVEALKQHRVYQGEACVKAGLRWREQGIVFPNIYGGFFSPVQVWKLFHGLLKKAGLLGVWLHDLRHSVATILRASGVDLKVIQGLLGHSSMAITADIYSHVLPEEQGETARRMDGFSSVRERGSGSITGVNPFYRFMHPFDDSGETWGSINSRGCNPLAYTCIGTFNVTRLQADCSAFRCEKAMLSGSKRVRKREHSS